MAAELLTDASRALDANANPFSGAKWYFYTTGTLTPQSVYTTAALSVAHANPVVADAGGKFPPIYFDASLQYRGILENDSGTTTIYDIDPINSGVFSQLSGSGGAALVGTKQTGSNTANRTDLAKNNDIVSLADFTGIDMTGATNSATGFSNAVADGRKLLVPAGTVKIDTDLTLTADTLFLEGQGEGSILDFSGGGSLSLAKVPVAIPDLTANLTAGENALTFASAHGLVAGDVVVLYNPTDDSFADFTDREYYRDGAMFRIAAVPTTTTAVIYGVSHRTFAFGSVDCYKLTGGKITLRNFRVIPPATGIPLQIDGHQGVTIHDLTFDEGSADTSVEISRSFDFDVARLESTAENGDAYPLVIVNSQVGRIYGCSLYSPRHSLSMGGRDWICAVPCRDVTVIANSLMNDATLGIGAADSHGNCEDIVFTENTLNSGINASGLNITVTNNRIYGRPPSAFPDGNCIYGNDVVGGVYTISGNTLYTWGDGDPIGITYLDASKRNRDLTLVAHGNTIVSAGSGAATVRMFTIELGSTAGTFRVDTKIQEINYIGTAAFSVLALTGTADISAISSHVVDGVSAPSGTALIVASASANYTAPMRLQRQEGSVTLAATSGTERTIASPITLRYPYPRVPNGGATATGQAVGDKLPQGSLFDLSATAVRPQIASASNTNFNATADRVVSWWTGVADL